MAGGTQDDPDDAGVNEDGRGQAEAQELQHALVAEDERHEHRDHDGGRGGDDPGRRGKSVGHRGGVVAAQQVLLTHA